jgi:hypothetical protein
MSHHISHRTFHPTFIVHHIAHFIMCQLKQLLSLQSKSLFHGVSLNYFEVEPPRCYSLADY